MTRIFRTTLLAYMFTAALAGQVRAEDAARSILTEASVWRTHVTWGPAMGVKGGSLKPMRFPTQMKIVTSPPAAAWTGPGFDDGSWGFWRETHDDGTVQSSDVPLYDTWQYGMQQAPVMRRRCLRGRFRVDDPAGVARLALTVTYRGGVAVFLNGREAGSGHLSKEARKDPEGLAEAYPKDVYFAPGGKLWDLKNGSIGTIDLEDEGRRRAFNRRMRTLAVDLPTGALRKGVNVLALDVRAPAAPEEAGVQRWWNPCGAAVIDLRGTGAAAPAVERPRGVQVWVASQLFKASPFGSITQTRVSNGRGVLLWNFPLSWVGEAEGTGSIRMVGTRNGVFAGQAIVTSNNNIRGLRAEVSDLVAKGGASRIPPANCRVGYMAFPKEPPAFLTDPSVSMLDALLDAPPAEIPACPAKPFPGMPDLSKRRGGASWNEGGATAPVWVKVKVPKDASEGEYAGTMTIRAEGMTPVAVPVHLKVYGYTLPDSRAFTPHVGLLHSPESLAVKYDVPLWSDEHLALVEKTCAFMGELGGSVVYVPLVEKTWLGNRRSMVYWVKDGNGHTHDFSLLDRYLDLVCRYMDPRVVCLYVYHPTGRKPGTGTVTTLNGGTVGSMPAPAYGATKEAIAFWKPVIAGVNERLKKRGLDGCVVLGMAVESGRRGDEMKPVVELFKETWPGGKWTDFAHFGAKEGDLNGVPYGYVMSVWGNESPFKSTRWGAPDLPFVLVKHYRGDPVIDLRPIASRGSLYLAAETAMGVTFWARGGAGKQTQGIGPLGMDFWNFTAGERGGRRAGSFEGRVTNLMMSAFSTAAFLAPGPDGPVPTARFEVFRQGLQVCEARAFLERALEGGALDDALAARCRSVLDARMETLRVVGCSEQNAQGEGWAWFESSGWAELTGELFACATEVAKALND